jgi:hypothetical protein
MSLNRTHVGKSVGEDLAEVLGGQECEGSELWLGAAKCSAGAEYVTPETIVR